jgi:hypothetical protein
MVTYRYNPRASFASKCCGTLNNLIHDKDDYGNYTTRWMTMILMLTVLVSITIPAAHMLAPDCVKHPEMLSCTTIIVPLSWDSDLSVQRVAGAVDLAGRLAHTLAMPPNFATLRLIGPDPKNYTHLLPLGARAHYISMLSEEYMMPMSATTAYQEGDGWTVFVSHEYERGCMLDCLSDHVPEVNTTVYFLYDVILNSTLFDWRTLLGCPCG